MARHKVDIVAQWKEPLFDRTQQVCMIATRKVGSTD
jgi:hypothetical protein